MTTHYNRIKTKRDGDSLCKHVKAIHKKKLRECWQWRRTSCAIECNVTSLKVKLGWLQSLEKRNNYGNGGGWETATHQDW